MAGTHCTRKVSTISIFDRPTFPLSHDGGPCYRPEGEDLVTGLRVKERAKGSTERSNYSFVYLLIKDIE